MGGHKLASDGLPPDLLRPQPGLSTEKQQSMQIKCKERKEAFASD